MSDTSSRDTSRLRLPGLGWLAGVGRERRAEPGGGDDGLAIPPLPAAVAPAVRQAPAPPRALSPVEPRYVALASFQEARLVVERATGMIGCVVADDTTPPCVKLAGFVLDSRPDLLFLASDTAELVPLGLQFRRLRTALFVVQQTPAGDGQVTLHDPMSGRYLSAPPLRGGELVYVTASRDKALGWEQFSLQPLPGAELSMAVREAATVMSLLLARADDADAVAGFIEAGGGEMSGAALDAILPLLDVADLGELAALLLSRPLLRAALAARCPGDVWATSGLPSLASWLAGRDSGRAPVRSIGPELDNLARDGEDRGFVSFAHACATFARRSVAPRRESCIVMSARNEGVYLLEWIAHHRAVGFEGFFIYTNNNEDGSDALLQALADEGVITWIRSEMALGVSPQRKAFGHAFGMLPEVLDYEWCLVCDADEFFLPNPARFDSVGAFLSWQKKYEVDAIALNWRFMRSTAEGGALDGLLSQRNGRIVDHAYVGDGHRLVKTMFRPRVMMQAKAHTPICHERGNFTYRLSTGTPHEYRNNPPGFHTDPGFSDSVNLENACINHYFFKSAEEWLWKSARNRGDNPLSSGVPLSMFNADWLGNFMRQHDVPAGDDPALDDRITQFRSRTEAELAMLMARPAIEAAAAGVRDGYGRRLADIRRTLREAGVAEQLDETGRRFLALAGVTPAAGD